MTTSDLRSAPAAADEPNWSVDDGPDLVATALASGDARSARFFREILDDLDDQIVRFDATDLTVRYCNPAWARRFGSTPADLVGRPVDLHFDDQQRAWLVAGLERLTRREPAADRSVVEHRSPDGTTRHELWQEHLIDGGEAPDVVFAGRDVTLLATARAEIAASAARHRRLVEDLALPAFAISHEGIILFANRAGAAHLGTADPAELIGRRWPEFIHPDDLVDLERKLGDGLVVGTAELRMSNGRGGWWLADGAAVETEFDGVPAALIVQRDVTAQRAAERQLAESERREWLMLNSLAEAVLLHDETGRITFATDRAAELFGETESEMLLGLHTDTWISDGIDADGNPLGRAGLVDPVFLTGEPKVNLEFLLASVDDPTETRWLRASAMPITDLGASAPTSVVCSVTDITVERRTREALEASEARFRGLVENLAEGLILVGANGEFISANSAAERLLSRSTDTMRNTGVFDPSWQLIDGDGHPLPIDDLPARTALRTGTGVRDEVIGIVIPSTLQFRGQRGPDETRWLSVTTQSIDEDGERRVVVLFSDITDRRRAEQALEHQANHDALTGLPNRANLMARLALAVRHPSSHRTSVMFLDLDHFKPVNDTYGHDAGDELLCAVAGRVQRQLREGDTVARVGGDEFVVIAHGLDDDDAAVALADRLRDVVRRPFRLRKAKVSIDVSIGVVGAGPYNDVDTLLAAADTEMYRIKQERHAETGRTSRR